MSAAGLERVNVTQRKFFSLRAANSLSSTTTIRGEPVELFSGAGRLRESAAVLRAWPERRPLNDEDAGECHPREWKPSGRRRSGGGGSTVASARRTGPAAAITTFEPWLKPWPE